MPSFRKIMKYCFIAILIAPFAYFVGDKLINLFASRHHQIEVVAELGKDSDGHKRYARLGLAGEHLVLFPRSARPGTSQRALEENKVSIYSLADQSLTDTSFFLPAETVKFAYLDSPSGCYYGHKAVYGLYDRPGEPDGYFSVTFDPVLNELKTEQFEAYDLSYHCDSVPALPEDICDGKRISAGIMNCYQSISHDKGAIVYRDGKLFHVAADGTERTFTVVEKDGTTSEWRSRIYLRTSSDPNKLIFYSSGGTIIFDLTTATVHIDTEWDFERLLRYNWFNGSYHGYFVMPAASYLIVEQDEALNFVHKERLTYTAAFHNITSGPIASADGKEAYFMVADENNDSVLMRWRVKE